MATTPLASATDEATIDRFAAAAAAAGSVVHRADSLAVVGELARALADGAPVLVTTAVGDDPLLRSVLGADARSTADATEAADRPVAVERGTLAVAETGSVLVREPDRASRLASMLARSLIQVLRTDEVVAGLDDVGTWLVANAAGGYAALVTGPSRTADIERVLTVGVQGPAELHVVLVDTDGWTRSGTPDDDGTPPVPVAGP